MGQKSNITAAEEREIMDAIKSGFSANEIHELTGRSVASIYRCKKKLNNKASTKPIIIVTRPPVAKTVVKMNEKEELKIEEGENFTFNVDNTYPAVFGSANVIKASLVESRHEYGNDINLSIFKNIDNNLMFDYSAQLDICIKFLEENLIAEQTLEVYCSGLQSALASIIKACYIKHVNLVLRHFNNETSKYNSQVIFNKYNTFYQSSDFMNLYKFSTILTYRKFNIVENNEYYAIMVAENNNSGEYCKKHLILTIDEKDAWEVYPKVVRQIMSNKECKLAALLFNANTNNGYINMTDCLTKSYNFSKKEK